VGQPDHGCFDWAGESPATLPANLELLFPDGSKMADRIAGSHVVIRIGFNQPAPGGKIVVDAGEDKYPHCARLYYG